MSKESKPVGLEENRIIYVDGTFDESMTKSVYKSLIAMELKDPTKDILLIIDSYGGIVHSFNAIHDAIKMSRCDVATICVGKAMSCGQLLLMSGTKGKRFITPNSRVLVHEICAGTSGKLAELEVDIHEYKSTQKRIEKLIKRYTTMSKKKIKDLMTRDSFLSAKESKKNGIVDHIVTSNKDLFKRINL